MYRFVRSDGDALLLHTDDEAPLGRVVRVALPADGGRDVVFEPVDVVPESGSALESVTAGGDELVTVHLVDAQPRVSRHALDGSALGRVEVPGGSVVALNGRAGRDEVFLGLTSVTSR